MAPVKEGEYEYKPESIIELRKKLGLNQTQMASHLGIPVNTLYRWETGATTPDANSLAGIYSVAMDKGISPSFFKRRKKSMKEQNIRNRLIIMWDFQNLGVSDYYTKAVHDWMQTLFNKLFPSINNRLFKAFANPTQSAATDILNDLGWRVWEDSSDFDNEIVDQSRSDCGQDPQSNILVIITKDGDFKEAIVELQNKGVRVYILGPWDTSRALIDTVGSKRYIPWPSNVPVQSPIKYWVQPHL